MIYGNFLFFWADNNKCKLSNLQKEDCRKNNHSFLYVAMLLLVLFGLLVIANTCMVIFEMMIKFCEIQM